MFARQLVMQVSPLQQAQAQQVQRQMEADALLAKELRRPLRILELGSGVGLLGIGLALCTGAHVVLTDPAIRTNFDEGPDEEQGTTLDWLASNVELNREAVRLAGGATQVAPLRWGDAEHVSALRASCPHGFDLVVGSDLLYDPTHYPSLIDTLVDFGAGPTGESTPPPADRATVALGYPRRHPGEARFFEAASRRLAVLDTTSLELPSSRSAAAAAAATAAATGGSGAGSGSGYGGGAAVTRFAPLVA